MPQAMKAWFYPGRSIGEEFIYPKQQALAIAQANSTTVLSNEGDTVGRVSSSGSFDQASTTSASTTSASTTSTSTTSTTTADATTTAATDSTTTAPAPIVEAPAPVAEAEVVAPAPAPAVRQEARPVGTAGQVARSLPRTASPLALFELIGALSIAGGAGLRQLGKRA
jgi:hypothetical protein